MSENVAVQMLLELRHDWCYDLFFFSRDNLFQYPTTLSEKPNTQPDPLLMQLHAFSMALLLSSESRALSSCSSAASHEEL